VEINDYKLKEGVHTIMTDNKTKQSDKTGQPNETIQTSKTSKTDKTQNQISQTDQVSYTSNQIIQSSQPAPTLQGFRRELTRELFEELGALQCPVKEILGYIGTDRPKLEKWARRAYGAYGRKHSLDEILTAVRQDGLIAIRRASFDQLKKSATIISQQYNRFLPDAGAEDESAGRAAVEAFAELMNSDDEENVEALFRE